MQHRPDRHALACKLVSILAAAPEQALTIMSAKDAFCGATKPISDFHIALGYAEINGWLEQSRDHLWVKLLPDSRLVAERSAVTAAA